MRSWEWDYRSRFDSRFPQQQGGSITDTHIAHAEPNMILRYRCKCRAFWHVVLHRVELRGICILCQRELDAVGGLQEGSVSDREGIVGVTVDLGCCMEMVKILDLSVTGWLRGFSARRQWWLVIVFGH